MNQSTTETALPPATALPWYLSSASLWMAGMSLQGFLVSWLLVGILAVSADQAGYARSMAELPPLAILLFGGLLGDRTDGRRYLMSMHLLMALPPLGLAMVFELGQLSYWWVVIFGVCMAGTQALSDPSRQAALSRVTRLDIQRTVTLMTVVTSTVGIGGFYLGGHLQDWGLTLVLVLQSVLFFAGIVGISRLPPLPSVSAPSQAPMLTRVLEGFSMVWRLTLVRNMIGLNFLSSLFNAGAYIIAIPYIATEVYGGDAAFLAQVMIVFTLGGVLSNVLLFWLMPLRHPGRLFAMMQITRMLILGLLWTQPALWLFYVLLFAWGVNMGVTTTMVRTTVQELAPAAERSQILSVLLLSFMVSSPISAILLGEVISGFSPLTALLPGIVVSLAIFAMTLAVSGLWHYDTEAEHRLMADR